MQAAWLYAQMVRWGQVADVGGIPRRSQGVFRPDLYDAILGPGAPMPSGEPADGVGAFTGPAFDPDDIAAHLDGWKIRRR